jgi:hypothetical protein
MWLRSVDNVLFRAILQKSYGFSDQVNADVTTTSTAASLSGDIVTFNFLKEVFPLSKYGLEFNTAKTIANQDWKTI